MISVQIWMGCFNTTDGASGPALLNGGSIGLCDTGGYGDIFLLVGGAVPDNRLPEPASLALALLALGGLAALRRQH